MAWMDRYSPMYGDNFNPGAESGVPGGGACARGRRNDQMLILAAYLSEEAPRTPPKLTTMFLKGNSCVLVVQTSPADLTR
jgi:hypothetical protein